MEKKQEILKYRERLDQTLASPDLVNTASIKTLVNNQLLQSSSCVVEDVIQRRTAEVSNFLQLLRSASGNESEATKTDGTLHNGWKLKQDNDQHRIMYRECPNGTPFHNLLIEGYVDGPIDVCVCVGWETTLFKKWWPQFSVPPFKVINSTSLKKIRIGEEISLVRLKVPWPMTTREAVLHNFELEYFQDDLVVVLINTVPETQHIEMRTHGFTRDGIPEARDIVRVDLVGGFAMQKVKSNGTYFRTILNVDLKIDFVPPTLINFISRQILGSGFKLYRKIVASAASGDEDFGKALEGPMYIRIREGLKSNNKGKETETVENEKSKVVLGEEYAVEAAEVHKPVVNHALFSEIEEEDQHINDSSTFQFAEPCQVNKENYSASPEKEQAPGVLDSNATHVRGSGNLDDSLIEPGSANRQLFDLEEVSNSSSTSFQDSAAYSDATREVCGH